MFYKKLNSFEFVLALLTSIFIFIFYLSFNLNYLTKFVDEKLDSNTYRNYIYRYLISEKNKSTDIQDKFNIINPHHIAFDWTGMQFYKLLNKDKIYNPKDLMIVLQLRNLLVSSFCLSILFFIFFKISKKYILSLLTSSLIAFSCGFWIYSQINDTPLIHSAILAILFFLSIYFPYTKNKYLYSFFLGIVHALNIFFHQSDLIFIFVIIFIILFSEYFKIEHYINDKNELKKYFISNNHLYNNNCIITGNIKYLLIYLFTLGFIIISAYYYVGIVFIGLTLDIKNAITINNIEKSSYFFNWLILYSKIEYWGKGYEGNTLFKAIIGIRDYFYEPNLYYNNSKILLNFSDLLNPVFMLPNIIFMFCIVILFFSIIFWFDIFNKYKYVILSNILFLFIYVVFALWWEPDYREFWIAPMFSFWFLAFFILNYFIDKFKIFNPVHKIFSYLYIFVFSFLLFFINFTGFLYKYSNKNFRKYDIIKNIDANLIIQKDQKNK